MKNEISNRIQSGWRNWRKCSGVLCDRKIPLKLKRKVYKTVIRPAMLYAAETWATKEMDKKRLDHFLPCHFWSSSTSAPFYSHLHTLLPPIIPLLPPFLNICPIHLSLLHLITSLIFSMPILSLSSAFVFSLSDTPHIHLTILISALNFCFLLSIHIPCFTSIHH